MPVEELLAQLDALLAENEAAKWGEAAAIDFVPPSLHQRGSSRASTASSEALSSCLDSTDEEGSSRTSMMEDSNELIEWLKASKDVSMGSRSVRHQRKSEEDGSATPIATTPVLPNDGVIVSHLERSSHSIPHSPAEPLPSPSTAPCCPVGDCNRVLVPVKRYYKVEIDGEWARTSRYAGACPIHGHRVSPRQLLNRVAAVAHSSAKRPRQRSVPSLELRAGFFMAAPPTAPLPAVPHHESFASPRSAPLLKPIVCRDVTSPLTLPATIPFPMQTGISLGLKRLRADPERAASDPFTKLQSSAAGLSGCAPRRPPRPETRGLPVQIWI